MDTKLNSTYRITVGWENCFVGNYFMKNKLDYKIECSSRGGAKYVTFITILPEEDLLFLKLSQPNILIKPCIREEKVSN